MTLRLCFGFGERIRRAFNIFNFLRNPFIAALAPASVPGASLARQCHQPSILQLEAVLASSLRRASALHQAAMCRVVKVVAAWPLVPPSLSRRVEMKMGLLGEQLLYR